MPCFVGYASGRRDSTTSCSAWTAEAIWSVRSSYEAGSGRGQRSRTGSELADKGEESQHVHKEYEKLHDEEN